MKNNNGGVAAKEPDAAPLLLPISGYGGDDGKPDPEDALRSLISRLYTEEGRETAKVKAVERGVTNDPAFIDAALRHYKKDGRTSAMADLLDRVSDRKKAARLYNAIIRKYEKNGSYDMAFALAVKAGNIRKMTLLYRKVLERYERLGMFGRAAELAGEMKDEKRAELYKDLSELLGS